MISKHILSIKPLNEPELIFFLLTIRWFDLFPSTTNIFCTQLIVFKYCYLTFPQTPELEPHHRMQDFSHSVGSYLIRLVTLSVLQSSITRLDVFIVLLPIIIPNTSFKRYIINEINMKFHRLNLCIPTSVQGMRVNCI